MKSKHQIGQEGEIIVCAYLTAQGIVICERNYRNRYGEIDIIGLDIDKTILIIEVKHYRTRSIDPRLVINAKKKATLVNMALYYIQEKNLCDRQIRFDLVSLNQNKEIDHYKNICVL